MPKPKVLFLCTGNSCRSQMAEGWLRNIAGDSFEAFSAGITPVGINSTAIAVMSEIGIDISGQRSKSVSELLGQHFAYIITVCDSAREHCPIFPGPSERLHWSLEDPASSVGTDEQRLGVFRRVRDEIGDRVRQFVRRTTLHAASK